MDMMPAVLNNHVEMVYRPGERALAMKIFRLLGREVVDPGTPWLYVDNKRLVVAEVTPEQWAFEQMLATFMKNNDAAPVVATYMQGLHKKPQHYLHIGLGIETLEEWETLVNRVRDASVNDPQLRGRLHLGSVFRPGEPDAPSKNYLQAYVRTDVFAAGLLTIGQTLEIQHFVKAAKG